MSAEMFVSSKVEDPKVIMPGPASWVHEYVKVVESEVVASCRFDALTVWSAPALTTGLEASHVKDISSKEMFPAASVAVNLTV